MSGELRSNSQHKWMLMVRTFVMTVFLAIALCIAYLFALNGRYIQEDDGVYFDKWTKSIVEIVRYKTVE